MLNTLGIGSDDVHIEHLAIWTNQLEEMKDFYCNYFNGTCNEKYVNSKKAFESYFVFFESGTRLELMHTTGIVEHESLDMSANQGLTHFAMSLGSELAVRRMTERLRQDGYTISSDLRLTGDGYIESVVEDPDGNCLELII